MLQVMLDASSLAAPSDTRLSIAASPPPRSAAERRSLAPVLDHIDRHLADSLPLETLAALCGLSIWRFATVFRERVGVSPHRYVSERRVRRAQELLGQGVPPARAATEAGFYDQSHMNRRLKCLTGRSTRDARAGSRP